MNQKGISTIAIILLIVGVLAAAGGIYYFVLQKPSQQEQPILPTQPEEKPITSTQPEEGQLSSEINCAERVEYFLSKVPASFENIEKGIEWCNQCVSNNGIPTLSYDIGPSCNLKTSDAGKICKDSDQCKGICLAENERSKSGRCSDTETVLGCVFEMTNGEALGICFDY